MFSTHFNAISGSKWVQGLYEGNLPPKPHTALALSVATVSDLLLMGLFSKI